MIKPTCYGKAEEVGEETKCVSYLQIQTGWTFDSPLKGFNPLLDDFCFPCGSGDLQKSLIQLHRALQQNEQ